MPKLTLDLTSRAFYWQSRARGGVPFFECSKASNVLKEMLASQRQQRTLYIPSRSVDVLARVFMRVRFGSNPYVCKSAVGSCSSFEVKHCYLVLFQTFF